MRRLFTLFSLCLVFGALTSAAEAPESYQHCFPAKRISEGTFLKDYHIELEPTEICIEFSETRRVVITLFAAESPLAELILQDLKNKSVPNEFVAFSANVARVNLPSRRGRGIVPHNFYLFVDLILNLNPTRSPAAPDDFVRKVANHALYGGLDVLGEVKIGDEIFATLYDDGWGKKEGPKIPLPPSAGPNECDRRLVKSAAVDRP